MDQKISAALTAVRDSFVSLRTGLDQIVIGYSELKNALCCALLRRTLGMKGNLLVFSAPGLAKTTLIKGAAKLIGAMNGGHVAYARTQGRNDLMPEDFLSRRMADYDAEGKIRFQQVLQTVREFLAEEVSGLPGVYFFDELDKTPGRALHGLLEIMEEQSITVPGLGTKDLNFALFASANTRDYDPQAQPIPRATKDRFSSVVELGFLPLDDDISVLKMVGTGKKNPLPSVSHIESGNLDALRKLVAQQGLGNLVVIDDKIYQGCATVTKLTQSKVSGFTDFTDKFKTPAGPRSYIDLLQEAAVMSLLKGETAINPQTCIEVGCRVYRGRVEMSASVTGAGETADTWITKILYEVFGGTQSGSGSGGSGGSNPQ
ncbi:MoxR family ATPase [Candidatus Kuenenbacteria bacterium]|nr:MoxR family ATPase [Candidatus Kuenenbacteria bacterium]